MQALLTPRKAPQMQGFHPPKRTRTSTGESPHKALNLARLPIPPPARERARTIAAGRGVTGPASFPGTFPHSVRRPVTFTNTRSTNPASGGSARHGSDKAPAGDLRLHQALRGRARLPADGARHRQGRRPRVIVDGARPPGEPRAAGHDPPRSVQA